MVSNVSVAGFVKDHIYKEHSNCIYVGHAVLMFQSSVKIHTFQIIGFVESKYLKSFTHRLMVYILKYTVHDSAATCWRADLRH